MCRKEKKLLWESLQPDIFPNFIWQFIAHNLCSTFDLIDSCELPPPDNNNNN